MPSFSKICSNGYRRDTAQTNSSTGLYQVFIKTAIVLSFVLFIFFASNVAQAGMVYAQEAASSYAQEAAATYAQEAESQPILTTETDTVVIDGEIGYIL